VGASHAQSLAAITEYSLGRAVRVQVVARSVASTIAPTTTTTTKNPPSMNLSLQWSTIKHNGALSPDGLWEALVTHDDEAGEPSLTIKKTGELETKNDNNSSVWWSPGGQYVLYKVHCSVCYIWNVSSLRDPPFQIYYNQHTLPKWSDQDRHILVLLGRCAMVWSMDPFSSKHRLVVSEEVYSDNDEDHVQFIGSAGEAMEIIRADRSERRVIAPYYYDHTKPVSDMWQCLCTETGKHVHESWSYAPHRGGALRVKHDYSQSKSWWIIEQRGRKPMKVTTPFHNCRYSQVDLWSPDGRYALVGQTNGWTNASSIHFSVEVYSMPDWAVVARFSWQNFVGYPLVRWKEPDVVEFVSHRFNWDDGTKRFCVDLQPAVRWLSVSRRAMTTLTNTVP